MTYFDEVMGVILDTDNTASKSPRSMNGSPVTTSGASARRVLAHRGEDHHQ